MDFEPPVGFLTVDVEVSVQYAPVEVMVSAPVH